MATLWPGRQSRRVAFSSLRQPWPTTVTSDQCQPVQDSRCLGDTTLRAFIFFGLLRKGPFAWLAKTPLRS